MVNADEVLKLLEQRHGIFLKKSFYNAWYQSQSLSGSAAHHLERLYTGIFKHFLDSDMTACAEPFLQKKGIQQKMVLQLQHTTDTASSLYYLTDALDKNGPISRGNLKWIMTDGDRDIIVFELNKIPSMNLKTPFGSKVQITSGLYASGILLVKPENFQLLGGQVLELYGDTMENELLRRYNRQLQLQSNTEPGRTTRATPRTATTSTPIPAYQNNTRPTSTTTTSISSWANSSNSTRPITQTTSNAPPQQSIASTGTNGTTNSDEFDEFDDWPTDDFDNFDDLEELEQQATNTLIRLSTASTGNSINNNNTTNNPHLAQNRNGSSNSYATADGEFSQRPTSMNRSHTSRDTAAASTQIRRPTLSLSTAKPKRNLNTAPAAATTRSSPPPIYIDLDDDTPSLPLRPSTQNPGIIHQKTTAVSDFDNLMLDDSQWIGDHSQEGGKETTMDETEAPGILSVSELRTLLRSIDDNTFTGKFDKVSVQIQGCFITKMRQTSAKNGTQGPRGLYLTAELLENYSNKKPITVAFVYYGINSLFEGYTLKEIREMNAKHGVSATKQMLFIPLRTRLQKTQAVLEIDLTLNQMHSKDGVVRTCTKFTPMLPP